MTDDLIVIPLRLGPLWNFAYIVGSRRAGEAVVIDPAWDAGAILARVVREGLRVTAVAVTHAHDDHAHGLAEVVRATGAPVLVHGADACDLRQCWKGPVIHTAHGQELAMGALRPRLLHTPGHTPGSQSLLLGGALFTGDTLMVGALGRVGAWDGAVEAMWRTVSAVLAELPDDTAVYPGHDSGPHPVSTLGTERRRLPALMAPTFAAFRGLVAPGLR